MIFPNSGRALACRLRSGPMLSLGLCCVPFLMIVASAQTPIGQNPSSDPSLRGLQSTFLTAPIQRVYVDAPATEEETIRPEDLSLDLLTVGSNQRIYTKPAQVRAAIATNHALAVLLDSPQYGTALRNAFHRTILYAGLSHPGQQGFNEFNEPVAPGNMQFGKKVITRAIQRSLRTTQNGNAATAPASPETTAPGAGNGTAKAQGNLGFIGDIRASSAPNAAAKTQPDSIQAQAQERVEQARRSFPHELTAFVSLSRNGRQATLFVLGMLPAVPNQEVPINFTVEAKQYSPQTPDVEEVTDPDQRPVTTLLDKQTIAPADSSGAADRVFCFAYPLAMPPQDGQVNLFVNYWINPSMAYTYGIALAHIQPQNGTTVTSDWIAVPMTRLQRFQKDYRFSLIQNTEIGDAITMSTYRRKK